MGSNTITIIRLDDLKKKVRYIRASNLPAEEKIDAILEASINYDATEAEKVKYRIKQLLGNDEDRIKRYSKALLMEVQAMANRNAAWVMDDLRGIAQKCAVFDCYPLARHFWFGWSEDLYKDHNQWMERIFYEPTQDRLNNRIKKLLGDLLQSDFLNRDYADSIGIPPQEIAEARQKLKDWGFDENLDKIDGADWKYALLTKYIGEPIKSGETAPPSRVRWYISEAQISDEAALAYFRYVALVQLAYKELDRLQFEDGDGYNNRLLEETAVNAFIDKLNQLAQDCYDESNDKEVSQGGHLPKVKAVIKPNGLKAFLKNEKKENYEDLKKLCYPITNKNNLSQMKYIANIREQFFGKLPKSYIAQKAAPIFVLSESYIAQRI